jgi:hypothetical protein
MGFVRTAAGDTLIALIDVRKIVERPHEGGGHTVVAERRDGSVVTLERGYSLETLCRALDPTHARR